ncbi:MAG: SDR family oxidoreductase [Flavobacteriales bacterium]|nr:SDR family oxidoreductase [Flavobacteriales bacterium]
MSNQLIIGASSGIGAALASTLEQSGFNVYTTYNTQKPSSTERAQQFNVLDATFDPAFLPDELHGFTYCPGRIDLKPFGRIRQSDLEMDLALQVIGAVKTLQIVLPRLKASGNASVVFLSTVAVSAGFNYHAQVAISKGALEGLTRALAAEFAPTIRFNAIAPSLTDTPLAKTLLNSDAKREANAARHPLKRIGTPNDIAEMAAFLLSNKASWITGQVMHVDGGMSSIRS